MDRFLSNLTFRNLFWIGALCLYWTSGCSSPTYRIKQNPELFGSLPAEKQEKIRTGQIDIGFTPELVQLALGRPSRTYTRTTKSVEQWIWSYSSLSAGNFHRDYGTHSLCTYPSFRHRYYRYSPMYSAAYSTYESARVIFVNGLVTEIQVTDTENKMTY